MINYTIFEEVNVYNRIIDCFEISDYTRYEVCRYLENVCFPSVILPKIDFDIWERIYYYFEQLGFAINILEKEYFKNNELQLYHTCNTIKFVELLFLRGFQKSTLERCLGANTIFFAKEIYYSIMMSLRWTLKTNNSFQGFFILVPNLEKYNKYRKVYSDTENEYHNLEENINDSYETTSNSGNAIKHRSYNEIFIKSDLNLNDIKRVYLVNSEFEISHIINNKGNQFQIIDLKEINEVLRSYNN